jgi:hypothetical protein
MPEKDIIHVAQAITRLVAERHQPLNELTALCDKQLRLEGGTSLKVAYYLLATRQWRIDMNVPLDPDQPLAMLETELKVTPQEE